MVVDGALTSLPSVSQNTISFLLESLCEFTNLTLNVGIFTIRLLKYPIVIFPDTLLNVFTPLVPTEGRTKSTLSLDEIVGHVTNK